MLRMFDILMYLYESYWHPEACPEFGQLSRKLSAAGFENEEIHEALDWLRGLETAMTGLQSQQQQSERAMRLYAQQEFDCLGSEAIGYLNFLETAGVLKPNLRELTIERALATGMQPLPIEHLKTIVLMIFWRLDEQPDALILDELFVETGDRVVH
jgi:Smg protein